MAGRERVAFLGLGIMGWPMAANLCTAGFEVIVWNRTQTRGEEFAAHHRATLARTPAQAAEAADVVITMVQDAPEVDAVLFGPRGAAAGMRSGGRALDYWNRSLSIEPHQPQIREAAMAARSRL